VNTTPKASTRARHLIKPMMVVVLAAGLYLALDRWKLGA